MVRSEIYSACQGTDPPASFTVTVALASPTRMKSIYERTVEIIGKTAENPAHAAKAQAQRLHESSTSTEILAT